MTFPSRANPIDVSIGKRIAEIRRERNETPESIAQVLNLEPETYLAGEEGQFRFLAAHLFNLAQHFDVEISEFFKNVSLK